MTLLELFDQTILLGAIAAVALTASCVLWLKVKRLNQLLAQEIKNSHKELQLLTQTNIGLGRKFLEIEKQVKQLSLSQLLSGLESESDQNGDCASEGNRLSNGRDSNVQIDCSGSSAQTHSSKTQNNSEEGNHGTYNNAVNLFKQGMSAEEVAARCGLSKAEANLMALVNRELSPH